MKYISKNYRAIRLDQFIYCIYPLETCSDILHAYDSDCSEFCHVANTFRLRYDHIYCYNLMDSVDELYVDIYLKSKLVLDNWGMLRKFLCLSSYGNKFDGKGLIRKLFPINLPLDKFTAIKRIVLDERMTITFTVKDCRYEIITENNRSGMLFISFYEYLDDTVIYTIYQKICYDKEQVREIEEGITKVINEV